MRVVTYPGRSTDADEDFADWSMEMLRERVRLVQELDQLADRMVKEALYLAAHFEVVEENYYVPQARKVLTAKN